jgi:PadR family transcriptional regulator, regulatory protein PadR
MAVAAKKREEKQEKTEKHRYSGSYNRLFPLKVSTNTFVTIYILHLLKKKGSLYGKEIINEIEDRFSGKWKPSHGLVYPILRELEKENLVKGDWVGGEEKKTIRVYKITGQGLRAYEQEKTKHKNIFTESFMIMETLMGDLYKDFEVWDFSEMD